MAISTSSAKSSATLLSIATLLLLISSSSSTFLFSTNVLKSGDRLGSGQFLHQGQYHFVMQADCNVVLYSDDTPLWSSHTDGKGKDCYLSLQPSGELFLYSGNGNSVWRSETGEGFGRYALVLQPNGDVVIYGRSVWSTGLSYQGSTSINEPNTTNSTYP